MSFGVHSEVGKLRRVLVHRPGLEHTRLTPSNAEELLFDDVLWVRRAKAEHDMFCEVMRERDVEVFEAERLLAEALVKPEVKDWVCDHILSERQVGITASKRGREWVESADPAQVADFLIGGITSSDAERSIGLVWESADPTSMLLPPLPNFLFQRDPSCWIYDGVTLNPMTKPARMPETMIVEAIYRFHPMFIAEGFPIWLGGADENWGRAHVEGGDVQPIGNGAVMIGMGSALRPRPCCGSPVRCFAPARRGSCWQCTCRSHAPTCIWTP
jgi:arginine deiminase